MTKTKIYFIGGSPCSGKSTIAQMIADMYGMYYFKVDDYLDEYTEKGRIKGKEICTKLGGMTSQQIWMREPQIQCEEELQYYREVFEFSLDDLSKIDAPKGIITEGAAYLPELMRQSGIENNHYICITPTKKFQLSHYNLQERPFINYVLEGCIDKEKAFENWMNRDILFAESIRNQCEVTDYHSILMEGTVEVELTFSKVCTYFGI